MPGAAQCVPGAARCVPGAGRSSFKFLPPDAEIIKDYHNPFTLRD